MAVTTEAQKDHIVDAVEEAKEAWAVWLEARAELVGQLEANGYRTHRLEAYAVGTGSDEGGGQSMDQWLEEIVLDVTVGEDR